MLEKKVLGIVDMNNIRYVCALLLVFHVLDFAHITLIGKCF